MINIPKNIVGIFDKKHRAAEARINKAISELKAKDDRELQDIGIVRCNIEYVVRHGLSANDSSYDHDSAA